MCAYGRLPLDDNTAKTLHDTELYVNKKNDTGEDEENKNKQIEFEQIREQQIVIKIKSKICRLRNWNKCQYDNHSVAIPLGVGWVLSGQCGVTEKNTMYNTGRRDREKAQANKYVV